MVMLALGAFATWEGFFFFRQLDERWQVWETAKAYRARTGKPILLIGKRGNPLHPPNSEADVVLDLRPDVLELPNGVQASILDIPYPDKHFAVVCAEHVVEHMADTEAVQRAISECVRVADYAFVLVPSFWQVVGNRFNSQHPVELWLNASGQVVVRERSPEIGSVMLFSSRAPEVVETRDWP